MSFENLCKEDGMETYITAKNYWVHNKHYIVFY